jgi:hypothetical protein
MLKRMLNVFLMILGLIIIIPISFAGYFYLSYKDDIVNEGLAYGFQIGSSHTEVYDAAKILKQKGKIEEIHRYPENEYHKEFGDEDLNDAVIDNRWIMIVDPDWWNNSIYLEFDSGKLVKIRRFRMCCEMP